MSICEIEEAISKLGPDELARFREWYQGFDAPLWIGSHAEYDRLVK